MTEPTMSLLAELDAQPWAGRAMSAWRSYWEGRGELSPIDDPLARVRFMSFWERCRSEGGAHIIQLPFIGRGKDGDWLHLELLCSREELQASPSPAVVTGIE